MLIPAGVAYGLFYGLGFSLFAWGYDGWQLSAASAASPWAKLALGLPPVLVLSGVVGGLAAAISQAGVSAILWAVCGWMLGLIAGHLPFDGGNIWVWVSDRRLWGEIILPYDYAATVRTTLVVFSCAAAGVLVGLAESAAVQWAWDVGSGDRLRWRSYLVLLIVGVVAALPAAAIVNSLIDEPLRVHQVVVGQTVSAARNPAASDSVSEADLRSLRPFLDSIGGGYTSYFVSFGADTKSWHSAYVDLAFEDGFLLRCVTSGRHVIYCDDYSRRFAGWMSDLVRAGLYGERPWEEATVRRLKVGDEVLAVLEANRDYLAEEYVLSREEVAGRVFLTAHFADGAAMTCLFHGAAPVVAERCVFGE